MGVFERIKSAAAGAIPVEDDLDMGDSQRVRNLPAPANPNDAAPESEVSSQVESHRQNDTHASAQPPQSHGNAAHDANYITNAPVDSVNGQTGAVQIDSVSTTEEKAERFSDVTSVDVAQSSTRVVEAVIPLAAQTNPVVALEVDVTTEFEATDVQNVRIDSRSTIGVYDVSVPGQNSYNNTFDTSGEGIVYRAAVTAQNDGVGSQNVTVTITPTIKRLV